MKITKTGQSKQTFASPFCGTINFIFNCGIMPNTYTQLYIHTVFAVKFRRSLIKPHFGKQLFAVIGNLINETGCKTIIVNGVEDHVHCFFGLKPSISVSEIMKNAKAKSSKRINENSFIEHRFEWQPGFGAFSYSKSHIDAVYRYIQNQGIHHQKQTFREEYVGILKKFEVEYDEQYLFKDLE